MFRNSIFIIFVVFFLIVGGCSKAEPKDISQINTHNNSEKSDEVELVVIEESPARSTSPANAAIHQYKFVFKNNSEKFISKSEIANEVILGNKGIVTLDTQKINNNFVLLHYEKEDKWNISALIDVDINNGHFFEDKGGLNLPFNEFVVAKFTESDLKTWAFSSKEKVVAITKFARYPFENNKVKMQKTSDGKEIYVSEDPNNSYLYYFDSEFVIVISGNISIKEMRTLSESIPSVNSISFPMST
ncbi:hypothetical protein [Sporosarcina sp. BP05]|uniref:hypothetical protein n=1 Tax=Sporosarcina sp. BP05 TaxID=2758726 RepID=UPI00164831A7|nr:hypothetical protein [Sporosarcina sp. BP05]